MFSGKELWVLVAGANVGKGRVPQEFSSVVVVNPSSLTWLDIVAHWNEIKQKGQILEYLMQSSKSLLKKYRTKWKKTKINWITRSIRYWSRFEWLKNMIFFIS